MKTNKMLDQDNFLQLRRQKPVIFIGSLALAVVLLLGSTLAWFTAADYVRNPMRRNEYAKSFEVVEVDVFPPGQDTEGSMEKRVGSQNVGDLPAFVRLLVLPVFKSADDNLLPAALGRDGTPPDPANANVIIEDFNLATWNETEEKWNDDGDWAPGGDGYYYYLHRLDPMTSTEDLHKNLFNSLRLADMPEGYENATLIIEVKCEAVEPKNYREAWWGIPGNATPAEPFVPDDILAYILGIDDILKGQIK